MKEYLNIIEEIADKRYENSFILTFNCSLDFYENLILKRFLNNGCFNNVILMDQGQYDNLINNEKGRVYYCGSYYLCEGIKTKGVFHPKIILLTGKNFGKLLIGSGNTTPSGYGKNFELFYKFDYDDSHQDYLFLFQEVVGYIDQLFRKLRITLNPALTKRMEKLKEITPWLKQESVQTKERFLHNLDRPILGQILEITPKNLKKIFLAAPYYDDELGTVQNFQGKYPSSDIMILTQSGNTNFPIDHFLSNKKLFPHISLHKVSKPIADGRLFHGKFVYLTNRKREIFFSGSPNITKAALESTVTEGNVEVGILLSQESKNQFPSLWNEFLDKKKVSERKELLVNTKIEEIPIPETHSIKIIQAYLDGSVLHLNYESELTGLAELVLNGTHIIKIKLAKTGKIVESISAYLNQCKNDNCLFVQIKSKNYQSNLLWVSNTLIRKNTGKIDLSKQINSLTSYFQDLSYVDWMIELSPNLRRREYYVPQNIIKSSDLVNQEEGGEENELPENLRIVEEKSDYITLLEKASDPLIYKQDDNMLTELLSSLLHVFGKIVPTDRGDVSDRKLAVKEEKIHEVVERKKEIDISDIREKITTKIHRLISKNIASLNQLLVLDASMTQNLCNLLIFLVWAFDGIKIAVRDEEDRIFISARKYLEASVAILKRLWVGENVNDYLESKKNETDYIYLRMTSIHTLCLCLLSFDIWVLLNRDEFIEDLKKYEWALMEIFFAMREKINKGLPTAVVEDILAEEKVKKITKKLSNFNGFNISDINLLRLLRFKTNRAQIEKIIDIVNMERFSHLLGKKKQEHRKLEEELTKAMIRFEEQRQLLQTEPRKHILDYGMAEEDILKIKQKIEENERAITSLSNTKKVPKVKIRLPQEILRFFCLDI